LVLSAATTIPNAKIASKTLMSNVILCIIRSFLYFPNKC
jgi:hypothetical protein